MKQLTKFSKQLFKSLIAHLKKYNKRRDEESLHNIRVDVKKIKSVLELVNYSDKGFKAHQCYISFRTIFRRAGALRDPEIQAGLLLRYNIEGVKVNKRTDNNIIKAFVEDTRQFVNKILEQEKSVKPLIRKVTKHELKDFVKRKNRQIEKVITSRPKIAELHKIRKAMKLVIYLSEVHTSVKKKTLKFYREMEALIGDLHDKQVVLGLVTEGAKSGVDSYARKLILAECRESIAEIREHGKKFYTNHLQGG